MEFPYLRGKVKVESDMAFFRSRSHLNSSMKQKKIWTERQTQDKEIKQKIMCKSFPKAAHIKLSLMPEPRNSSWLSAVGNV